MSYFSLCTASLIFSASTVRLQSSSNSMSMHHEQGLRPFPFNQCWNIAWQHALGSLGCILSMMPSCVPLSSKSKITARSRQWEATVSMILIFSPLAVASTDSWARVGVVSASSLREDSYNYLITIPKLVNHLKLRTFSCTQRPAIIVKRQDWSRIMKFENVKPIVGIFGR